MRLKMFYLLSSLLMAFMLTACTSPQLIDSVAVGASLARIQGNTQHVKDILINEARPLMPAEDKVAIDAVITNAEVLQDQVKKLSGDDKLTSLMIATQVQVMVATGKDIVMEGEAIVGKVLPQLSYRSQLDLKQYRADLGRLGKMLDTIGVVKPESIQWTQVLTDIATIASALAPVL